MPPPVNEPYKVVLVATIKDGLLGEMTEQQRGFIGDIFSSGQHLLSLINDILDLSKVEAGKMELELAPVKLPSLFADSLSIIREKASARQIQLTMEAAPNLGTIHADARKVKQIVYNLLSNAVKFSREEGGHITFRAGLVPRANIGRASGAWKTRFCPLADSEFTEFLELSVADTGIGISDEGMERLFAPFSQIDSGLARKFEGTGLGLAMVKLLAELHGGTVAVASAAGEGSCFTVWLPVRATEGGELTLTKALVVPRSEAPSGRRVALVVEEDLKAAELIRLQLETEGFEVIVASDAELALARAVEQPLSLITLEIMLPDLDGWELLARLQSVPALARVPVVIISILADRNRGVALGAAAVLQKPVSRPELLGVLADLGFLPRAQLRPLSVLLVDDDPQAVELMALRLQGVATSFERAYSGREAIEMARRTLPDLLVLDLMMPEVNGFEVVEALRARPETAGIPILVVTAKSVSPEDRTRLNGCIAAIVAKSELDPQHLLAEVRRATFGRQVSP